MDEFIVHTVPGSPYARPVMALLEEKQVPWTIHRLNTGEHVCEPHLSRHPFGKMPVLEAGGRYIYETQAILRYLDETLPGPSFTPVGAEERLRMNQAIGICDAYLFPEAARTIVFQRVVGPAIFPGFEPDDEAVRAGMPRAHTIFAELSRLLGGDAWFGADRPCLADLMVGAQLELFARAPEWAELTGDRPNLATWLERVEALSGQRATVWEALAQRFAPAA